MKERPILFSGPMVRAILEGRKTQTRRVVKNQPPERFCHPLLTERRLTFHDEPHAFFSFPVWKYHQDCPYGVPGDRLWVRETFAFSTGHNRDEEDKPKNYAIVYKATWGGPALDGAWKPSIHMPRWASRILLEVVAVRVERLNAIGEADAKAEGAMYHNGGGVGHSGWRHDYKDVFGDARSSFASFWDSINAKKAPWASNPWVWAIEFRRVLQ